MLIKFVKIMNPTGEHFFKYRGISNLRYLLDILINKRLYAARYDELNDPMEGVYIADRLTANTIGLLRNGKYKTRICSLSKNYNNGLMWSHYAESHKGCCLELSITSRKCTCTEINYTDNMTTIDSHTADVGNILSVKSKNWKYEEEFRYFTEMTYLKINIHKIFLGMRMAKAEATFYKKVIQAIDSNVEVRQINEAEIDFGYI